MKFAFSTKAVIVAIVFVGIAHSTPNPNLYKRADAVEASQPTQSPQASQGPQTMTETNGAPSAEPAVQRPSGPSCPPPLRPFFTHCQIGPDCASCLQKEIPACAKVALDEKDLIIKPQQALCDHCSQRAIYFVCTKEGVAEDAARKKAAAQSSPVAPVSQNQVTPADQGQAAPVASDGPK